MADEEQIVHDDEVPQEQDMPRSPSASKAREIPEKKVHVSGQGSKAPPLHSRFILAIHFDIKMSCMGLDYTLNITSSTIDFELQMSIFTRLFWSKKSRPPNPAERFAIPCHRCRYLSPGQKGYFYMRNKANSVSK